MTVANASAQLRAISVALKAQGDTGSLREIRGAIRSGAAVGIPAVRQAALDRLPKHGGLNAYEADQKIRVAVLAGARTAGVRVIGKASQQTNTGTWRRPAFPRGTDRTQWQWREQTYALAAGWWSDTWAAQAPAITPGILAVMKTAAAKIERGL